MTPEEKAANRVGPGGYKCACCGPAPRARKKWRHMIRARLKSAYHKHIRTEIRENNCS